MAARDAMVKGVLRTHGGWVSLALLCAAGSAMVVGTPAAEAVAWRPTGWTPLVLLVALLPLLLGVAVRSARSRAGTDFPPRGWAAAWVLAALASGVCGVVLYTTQAPPVTDIGVVELGGSAVAGVRWPLALGGADLGAVLAWDFAFVVCYGTAMWMATTAARWVFWTTTGATWAAFGRALAVVTVLADTVENLALAAAWHSAAPSTSLDLAAVAATLKFTALVPAASVAVLGAGFVLGRVAVTWSPRYRDHWPDLVVSPPYPPELPGREPAGGRHEARATTAPSALQRCERAMVERARTGPVAATAAGVAASAAPWADVPGEERWSRGYDVPGYDEAERRGRPAGADASVGFCLSGGGIRSASFAMGVLQSMRSRLLGADYLVSVSGGGYASGALTLALTTAGEDAAGDAARAGASREGGEKDGGRCPPQPVTVRDPATAYQPGSVELDHLRRNSSYLGSTAVETVAALGVLARGLLASLAVLLAPAVALGVLSALAYDVAPVGFLRPDAAGGTVTLGPVRSTQAWAHPQVWSPQLLALAVPAVVATALWLAQISTKHLDPQSPRSGALHQQARRLARLATRALVMAVVLVVAVPSLCWVVSWAAAPERLDVQGIGPGTSVGAALLGYVATLAAMLWRNRTTMTGLFGSAKGKRTAPTAAVPRGLLQLILVVVTVTVLGMVWLWFLGVTALQTANELDPLRRGVPSTSALWVLGLALLTVLVLGVLVDESSLSLHPFYRKRLATALATRRVRFGSEPPVAAPYDRLEMTTLSTYGRLPPGCPQVVFAAAANLTGEHRAPPGLNAVSFTLNHRWCGGPDVGWVRTEGLEAVSPARLRRDVTVQAAIAISGAAIASSMGRFARWYQVLFAVTGARLGAWLPNPAFLDAVRRARVRTGDAAKAPADWSRPGLPNARRLPYLVREVVGLHTAEDRLLHVTDGGHYENLGMVECLRRRCSTIYCVDAGGDMPPLAKGVAEAVALAESELGVIVRLDEPYATEPGSGRPLTPHDPLAAMTARLSRTSVVTGSFTYPAASGLPECHRTGRIVIGRAVLDDDLPYHLVTYAGAHPEFPHDSTGDQWFDDGQFTAYTALGRAVGEEMLRA